MGEANLAVKNKNEEKLLNQSYWGGVFSRLKKNKRAMVALVVLSIIVLALTRNCWNVTQAV